MAEEPGQDPYGQSVYELKWIMGQILFSILMMVFVFMSIRWLWLQSQPPTDFIIRRWTPSRRLLTNREKDEWERDLAQLSRTSPGRGSTRE